MRTRVGRAVALAFVAVVAGCAHVPLTTLYELWKFDAANADPAAIRAAIRVPESLAPRPHGARLVLSRGAAADPARKEWKFDLEDVRDAKELDALTRFRRDGYPIFVFKLSDADVAEVRKVQAELRRNAANARVNLGVSLDACRRGKLPEGALLSSTYLKLDRAAGYLPVVEDIDLRKEMGQEATLAERVPPCESF